MTATAARGRAWHTAVRYVLVMLMMLGAPSVASAQASAPITIRTELLDATVVIGSEHYVLDHSMLEEYPHGRGERIYISSLESLGFAEISFFDDEDTPEETIDVMLSEFESSSSRFEVLERGNLERVHYALVSFRISGYEGYFYIEVAEDIEGNVDLAQSFYNLNSDFSEQLELVRNDVTIDGAPFLAAPAIDIDALVREHQVALATLAATPVVESVTFRGYPQTVTISTPLQIYSHFTNDVLEGVFFHTGSGQAYGLVGFVQHDGPTAEEVLSAIASDPPEGEEEPEELDVRPSSEDAAVGLYLVPSAQGDRLMIISVARYDEDSWLIESLAAPPDRFLEEYGEVVAHVTIEDRPFFDTIDVEGLVLDAAVAP